MPFSSYLPTVVLEVPGLSDKEFCTNNDYIRMLDELLVYTNHPEQYKATPLDRIYIPKRMGHRDLFPFLRIPIVVYRLFTN